MIMMVDRVYRYGCRAPHELPLAQQLLGQAWLYREDLRIAYNRQKKTQTEQWRAKQEATHVDAWEKHLASQEEIGHVHRFERANVWEENKQALNAAIREARSKRGHLLDAGTYWLIEKAILMASKASGTASISRAKDFMLDGRIGAALPSVDKFPAADTFEHPRVSLLRNPNKPRYHLLTIHVGPLAEGRSITWPIKIDRAFPPGAVIKGVVVQAVRHGHAWAWEALFTIAFDAAPRDLNTASGGVAVDIGWRKEGPEAWRVATHYGVGDDGSTTKGLLLIDTLAAFEFADSVRGFRDDLFNQACSYAATSGLEGGEHAKQWRNKSRLARLSLRHPTDLGLAWWRERDKHLESIEVAARTKAVRRRLDAFRAYADGLAEQFQWIALEDMPMADWVGEGETSARERSRSSAGLYLLQQAILHRFGADRVRWVPARDSTRTCAHCHAVHPVSVGAAPTWTCEGCHREHHQDENAAIILFERGRGSGEAGSARTRKAKKPKAKKSKVKPGVEARV